MTKSNDCYKPENIPLSVENQEIDYQRKKSSVIAILDQRANTIEGYTLDRFCRISGYPLQIRNARSSWLLPFKQFVERLEAERACKVRQLYPNMYSDPVRFYPYNSNFNPITEVISEPDLRYAQGKKKKRVKKIV